MGRFLTIARSVLGVVQLLLGPKIADYFEGRGDAARAEKRRLRAALAAEIVAGVIAYMRVHTKRDNLLEDIDAVIEEAYIALVEQNYSRAKAMGIARREVAKQLEATEKK